MSTAEIRRNKILVAGDIMLDIYCEGEIDRISPEAPVPVFRYKGKRYCAGGAANVAANLIAAGQEVSLLAVTGNDENGDKLIGILSSMGIDTGMIIKTDRVTTTKTRFLANNNQQVMRSDTEQTEDISENMEAAALKYLQDSIGDYDILVISDYQKGFLTKRLTEELIRLAREKGIRTVADIKDNKDGRYNGAYLLKPNKKELAALTGEQLKTDDDLIRAANGLLFKASCEYVLVTLGAGGMMLAGKDGVDFLPSCSREVFDVTGAGDTALGFLAAGLASGMDIKEAVRIANAASGIEVGKAGTYQPTMDEVMDLAGNLPYKDYPRIWKRSDAVKLRESLQGKKVVFTNGCFDILHVGHVQYLKEARKLGDVLIAGVNSDASVRRLKGDTRPVNTLNDRMEMLSALSFVDYVIPFEDDTPYELIRDIQPDLIVKGGDYRPEDVVGRDIVEAKGGSVVIIPQTEGKSTSSLLERIRHSLAQPAK
ncbi:MAG: D-glycero-beta-D-manno-heptose 1-phosphate adenylyltransferase [Lachnospiraceae bacterium]|nr:D-glycero-beta-D-manno-heptose 1-phosphate adenylyltransferase [Lachnospiraceae bacterium]